MEQFRIDPHKLAQSLQTGNLPVTLGGQPEPSSSSTSPTLTAAKETADRLFDLLPPLDVSDPPAFMTAVVAILASYPEEVREATIHPVNGIPSRTDRPTLKFIKSFCDEAYAPIERAWERERARQDWLLSLPPPRVQRRPEEQARVDEQVTAARRQLGIPEGARRREIQPEPEKRHDGKHFQRIAADLEARRARREATC